MRTNKLTIASIVLLNILIFGVLLYFAIHFFNDYRERMENEANISSSVAPSPIPVVADFSKQIAQGSPLIFGGVHHPPLSHEDAWNKMQEIGVTSMRSDFNIEYSTPNTSLEDYKNNKDDIANPDKWNKKHIEEKIGVYKKAKEKGMKTIGILAYAPKWLTYSNSQYGVPRDWEVYKDIVKKHYRIYRDYIDFIEIWNEPNLDFFMNVQNAPTTKEEAYKIMYQVAAEAIREVDNEMNDGKSVKIGGPVSFIPTDTKILESILSNPQSVEMTDFISYHNYEHIKEPSDEPYKAALKKYNVSKPIFITEWNVTPKMKDKHPLILTPQAINYTANKFISFLSMGIAAANYHSLKEVKEDSPRGDEGFLAFYYWKNNHAELLPQGKTWKLFSNTLGLGKGPSKIVETSPDNSEGINAIGFTNTYNQNSIIVVNNTTEDRLIQLSFKNVNSDSQWLRLQTYEVSADKDGNSISDEQIVFIKDKKDFSKKIFIDKESVLGITAVNNVNLYEKLKYHILTL